MSCLSVALAVFALSLVARDAFATDVAGKWGLGAGFANDSAELSLIRGRSARTAWLFETRFTATTSTEKSSGLGLPPGRLTRARVAAAAGPGLRRFLRPGEAFS